MHDAPIGFEEALTLTLGSVRPLASEKRRLADCLGAAAAEDVHARVDVPSAATSLRDGYAVRSVDLVQASTATPVKLAQTGVAAAGAPEQTRVGVKAVVRILTGGRIPLEADAVVAEEFTRRENGNVVIGKTVERGAHIQPRGAELAAGETVLRVGDHLTPGRLGLVAAAGLSQIRVYRQPRAAIIATGDEIRFPGKPLEAGQLYASNAVTLEAWCRRWRCVTVLKVLPDQLEAIRAALEEAVATCDVVFTSGGAWSGERDLVRAALERSRGRSVFNGVRMRPEKGTGLFLVDRCPVFMLSGGPPANLVGFLKLALPALLRMGGCPESGLAQQSVRLKDAVCGRRHWTRFVFGRLRIAGDGLAWFQVDRQTSRLKAIGQAQALLTIPEGVERIAAGTRVTVTSLM